MGRGYSEEMYKEGPLKASSRLAIVDTVGDEVPGLDGKGVSHERPH